MSRIKKFVGNKVFLSPVQDDDAECFTKYMNDMEVTDFTGTTHNIYNYAGEKSWITNIYSSEKNKTFCICRVEDEKVIGNISLMEIDYINRTAELGIMIGEEDSRSKGYGEEAINLLLDYGFNYLNLHSIYLRVNSINKRAIRCYEKVGFKPLGTKREDKFINGKYYDTIYMDLLKSEYIKESITNKTIK